MKHPLNQEDLKLIKMAKKIVKLRYDKDLTSIGAALRTKSGKIFTGINLKYHVRNVSMCAERIAIFKALEAGEREFDTIVGVKYFPETDTYKVITACGECRQVEAQHAPLKTIIEVEGKLVVIDIEDLLPYSFI
ncbi:MAG: cytidine deaminase [Patescibacteria group bacterium]|nr:cytidine deaminase [Patescibacteria group bacterium]